MAFFEIDTRLTNDSDQTVESVKLLGEHGVHTLLIHDWIFLLSGWDIESAGHLSKDSVGQLVDEVFTTTAASSSGAGLGNEDGLESEVCLVLVLGDGCVLVEAINLWISKLWKSCDVINIALIIGMLWRVVNTGR